MANAEQLLNEAQYAFSSINSGESRDNRRNATRTRSLCAKIIRKFPTSSEAVSAHAILKRLGDEAFSSKLKVLHRHSAEHKPLQMTASQSARPAAGQAGQLVKLNWRGLLEVIFNLPIASLAAVAAGLLVLFTAFGPFLLLPFVILVLFFRSIKGSRKPEQVEATNKVVERVNAYIDGKRSGRNGY